ncbi:MAG: patatin-like phospholipase family protein [Caldisericia bacterium]|nr:patatin-like phospholipase family protein [Caldisericia bacterium]
MDKSTFGLVLEGGGAKGSYHLGAYKAMVEEGLIPSAVVGTSIGALNAALIAQGDWDVIYDLWNNMSLSKILDIDANQIKKLKKYNFSIDGFKYFAGYLHKSIEDGGLDTGRIRKLLEGMVNEEKLRKSKMDFGLVTISLSELKPYELFKKEIPKGKIIDYLMASSNFPIFKREIIDDKKFIDGGIFDNSPIQPLKSKGYKSLIVIRTHGLGINRHTSVKGLDVTWINPSDELGGTLDFSKETCQRNLNLGYYDAMKTFRHLYGKKYYFKPVNNELLLINQLLEMPPNVVKDLASMLGVSETYSHSRMILEGILPRIASLLNIPGSSPYEEIIEIACEEAAAKIGLDRFKIYTLDGMINELRAKHHFSQKTSISKWLNMPFGSEIFQAAFKNKLVEEVILKVIHLPENNSNALF